ncbi:hypothetical protein ACIBHX_46575 [Nonomuraea sp. NPDC050536]|uniref:hypothetical protein n=1 Tax=Nonomuraea sp. NPDC050536 TaxID=3364366 RepID=UPI0037C6F052
MMGASRQLWALTVRQPWAWALAWGGKNIENRSWTTSYRGWIAIHAGKTLVDDVGRAQQFIQERMGWRWRPHHARQSVRARGQVLALARLDAVCAGPVEGCACPMDSAWATVGAFHWRFGAWQHLRRPVATAGGLGLWNLPQAAADAVLAQLDEHAVHAVIAHG